ncbi:DUF6177 family protein [Streptomyces monticola]|uniref:DUF6177 family protein n=1 Tax=Streptomyces monticola TaxID=2666263 RepID=A0ABW2JM27_9ACTN
MTKDVIALTEKMPDPASILAGLYAGGPDLGIQAVADGAVIQLCTPQGHPLVSVEAPLLLQVPGEAARLLGSEITVPEGPLWWTELHASSAAPEAERLAATFAGRLTTILGGTTWPAYANSTEVVPLSSESAALPSQDDTLPTADMHTDKATVVLTDRPVLALSAWLSNLLRTAIQEERALQIVTPPHTHLTIAARTALSAQQGSWVVPNDVHGYYDGFSGAVLHWQDGSFTPVRNNDGKTPVAQPFTAFTDTGERQLVLTLGTVHEAGEDLVLGGALEAAWQALTGAAPGGWSTAEPVNLPWSKRQLTDLARSRAPQPTLLTVVGAPDRPAVANLRVSRTTAGVEEHITMTLGYAAGEAPPLETLDSLAVTLSADHGLASMLTSLRPARHDLSVPPHAEPAPMPVSFTLGADAVQNIGMNHALRPPMELTPRQLGPAARPVVHYALGDGSDKQAWPRLRELTQHLKKA